MLTVLFASHNGALTLPDMLNALEQVTPPSGGWKIVAVDNASTDDTAKILHDRSARLPISVLHEARRGKNCALNSGLDHLEGDLVILTDDDIIPASDWLQQARDAADSATTFQIFGGAIYPVWPGEIPAWSGAIDLGINFSVTPASLKDGPVDPRYVWGPNMMVRTDVFRAGHRFDEAWGPKLGQYRMGSETEFTTRLVEEHGMHAAHVPSMRVGHIIRKTQLELDWVIKRAYRFGRGAGYNGQRQNFTSLLRPVSWALQKLLKQYLAATSAKLRGEYLEYVEALWNIEYFKGQLRGYADALEWSS